MSTKPREFPITASNKMFPKVPKNMTSKNGPLYPLITPATKSPTERKRRECNYNRLPHKVRYAIASAGTRNCNHVIQYSIGVYEIRLENGNSIIVNTTSGYGSGIKTRRIKNKKKKSKRVC